MSKSYHLQSNSAPIMVLDRFRDSIQNTKHVSQVLLRARIKRYYFDACNAEDRANYLIFLRTGKWMKQYYFKPPYTNVVSMIERELIEYALRSVEPDVKPIIDSIHARHAEVTAAA